jgi:hypothetical protein
MRAVLFLGVLLRAEAFPSLPGIAQAYAVLRSNRLIVFPELKKKQLIM